LRLTPITEQQNYSYEITSRSNAAVTQHKAGGQMRKQKDDRLVVEYVPG